MLRIAICDDDEVLCHSLEDMILCADSVHGGKVSTDVFFDGESLCEYMSQGNHFDLIFLDIALERLDGISVGHKIRDSLNDDVVQLVFISSNDSYAMELFAVRPMNFLIKPISNEKLQQTLLQAYRLIKNDNVMFEYQINRQSYYISMRKICYFEVANRQITIHTKNETITYYGKLSEVIEKVKRQRFLRINRSQLVNYDAVELYQKDMVRLCSNVELQIGHTRQKEVQERMHAYAEEDL